MPCFYVPAAAAAEAGTGAGTGPATSDYYAVECLGVETMTGDKFKEGSFRLNLRFDTGDEGGELLSASHDGDGNPIAGLTQEKVLNRVKFLNGVMDSFGFTAEQRNAGGYTDEWLIGATGYVEWHAASDLGAQFGKIQRWLKRGDFEALKARGAKPVVGRARGAPGQQGAPRQGAPQGAPAAGPRPGAPAPSNGTVQAGTARAPRPPAPPTARSA